MEQTLIAIDIGGTKLAVGVADLEEFRANGKFAAIRKEPIPAPGTPDAVIPRALELARELAAQNNGEIALIGISIGGPLDHVNGTVINFPHLPDWKNVPLVQLISEGLSAPAVLDNDANVGALAEHRFGAGRGCNDMVYMTLSTGIGGGIIIGGNLVHGVGSAAAELGHITVQTGGPICLCGNRGCLERMASGTNVARAAREASTENPEKATALIALAGNNVDAITAAHVVTATKSGDPLATQIWEQACEYLAIGIGSIIHTLAPEMVVLGGGVSQAGEDLLIPLRRRLTNHVFFVPLEKVQVVTAALGHDSALVGAGVLGSTLF